METDESVYYATPQVRGKIAHEGIDKKTYSTRKDDIASLPVFSEKYGLIGKIDLLKNKEHILIERKYQIKQIFQGQIYQLWAQYLCLVEMGYQVEKLAFYEISTNKMIPVELPNEEELIKIGGKRQVPFIIDRDNKVEMYESDEIIEYLKTL